MEICPSKQLQSVAWHFLAQSHEDQERAYALARAASEAPELGPEFGGLADTDFVLAANQLWYGDSLLHQGEVAQAMILVNDSLQRFRRRGNQEFMAECLGVLGNFALLRGDIAESHAHLQEAMAIGTTHNLRIVHAEWQWLLGLVTLYGGDAREARRLVEECLPLCLEMKNTYHLALVYMVLAETALWEGELAQAAGWLEQSLAYYPPPQRITNAELQRLFIAGRLATGQGQYVQAATLFGQAEAAHRQLHYVYRGPMLPLIETALATVRAALEPEAFATAFTAGQQISVEEAYATILAPSSIV
jgi:ATP/maltotriose-dependent transcriptional regulator MalT